MNEPYDFDRELDEVERFIAAIQAGDIGTSAAMAAYRDRHRPAIARLRAELEAFRALLAEDEAAPGDASPDGSADGPLAGHPVSDADPEDER
jgi:hypothetical protein